MHYKFTNKLPFGMKKQISILILFLLSGIIEIKAQNDGQFVNKIYTQRIAFYTQKMGLTPEEAQKFWPVYNEYTKKKDLLAIEKKKLTNFYINNAATMTENDIDVTIQKYVQLDKQEASLLEEYNKKFRDILPASKVMKLYLAETQFKEWLLRQIRMRDEKI
jgi:hypothetical protein